jgi:hypothetical protein
LFLIIQKFPLHVLDLEEVDMDGSESDQELTGNETDESE